MSDEFNVWYLECHLLSPLNNVNQFTTPPILSILNVVIAMRNKPLLFKMWIYDISVHAVANVYYIHDGIALLYTFVFRQTLNFAFSVPLVLTMVPIC
jgi:hypothetical protein